MFLYYIFNILQYYKHTQFYTKFHNLLKKSNVSSEKKKVVGLKMLFILQMKKELDTRPRRKLGLSRNYYAFGGDPSDALVFLLQRNQMLLVL